MFKLLVILFVIKLQKFSSLLNLKIPQKTSFYEHCRQYVFPEIDAARRKNQLEQIQEMKSFGRMLELALDGQCDSPGHNATYNTVSAIDTATNKLINFRVVHVKVCKYLNETTHYVRGGQFDRPPPVVFRKMYLLKRG